MQAGATTLKLMADITDIQRKFAEISSLAQRTVAGVGRVFDGLGVQIGAALSVGGLAAWVKSAINAADEMSKLAQKTGVAVKDVAGLQLAFRQSGVAAEQMVPIMAKLGVAISGGNDALKAMGIASRNADGSLKSTRAVLGEVATAFAGYQDGAAKTALAVKLFGEEGAKLMPLLNGGAEALDQFDAMALKLGLTLDEQTAKQAERFNDTLDLMGQGMAGVGRQVAAQLLPTLSGLADQFFTSMSEGDRLARVSQFLAGILKGLYVVALGVVEVFSTVGKTLGGVAAIIVNVLQGNFSLAADIARQLKDDLTGGWKDTLAQMEQAWNATGSASFEAMAAANAQLKQQAPVIEAGTKAMKEREEAEKKALKDRIEAAKYANEQWDEEFRRLEEQRNATERRIRDGREMLEQIEFETRLIGMNNTEREVSIAMRELERKGVVKGTEAFKAYADAIRSAIVNREAAKAAQDLRDREQQEWKKHWDQVSQSFVDALMQGGKSVAEYLKSLFRTLVLRPILAPIGGAFASVFGGGASAADLLGGGGATGSTFNILSAAKSAYEAISTGFASLGNSVAFAADSMGAWLVNNTSGVLNQMGGSLMQSAGSLGTAASYLGGAAAGLALGSVISGGYSAIGKSGNTANIAGTAIGAIFGGPIGAAIGGAIGGLFNRAFGRKAPVTTGSGITGTFSTGGANVRQYQEWFSKGGWFRSDKSGVNYSSVSNALDGFLDDSLRQITAATKMYADVLGLNANAINGITQSVKISLMGLNAEQQQERIMQALSAFGDRLAATYFNPFRRAGETAGEALARMANSLVTVNQVFDTLNQRLMGASLAAGDAASALLEIFGGTEAFIQATSAYYQRFYTEAERTAIATRQLTEVLATMNMELPGSREEFRALVESQNLLTESGRQNYAALIRLSVIFDEITPKIDSMADSLQQAADAIRQSTLDAFDEQIAASRSAASQARESARAYFELSRSLRESASVVFRQTLNGTQTRAMLAAQFGGLSASAMSGNQDAMGQLGGVGVAYVDSLRQSSATRADFVRQAMQVQTQLQAVADVADAMGGAADYQAMLYDVNTAVLEVLRDGLATGDMTLEALQDQIGVLQTISTMLQDSGQLQSESLDINAVVAQATGGSEALLMQVLDKLGLSVSDNQTLIQTIASGNEWLGAQIGLLVTTLTAQAEAAARVKQMQDAYLVQQFNSLVSQGTSASQALPAAQAEELKRARELVANYIRFGNVQNYLGVSAPAEIARLQVWEDTLSNSLNRLSGVADSQVMSFAQTLLRADSGRLRAGLGSTSTFMNAQSRFGAAVSLEDQLLASIVQVTESLKALRAERPDLFKGIPRFAAGGWHTGGLRLVGENGPELEATGPSRIYNASQTAAMLGGGGAVADEIRALREEVAMLRYEARATAVNTAKTTRMLDDVTQRGTAIRTTEVAA